MNDLIWLFLAYFVFIGLRAFQQINVQLDQKKLVVPTSIMMAAVEVYCVSTLAAKGWSVLTVASYGLAAGLGSLAAMSIQKQYRTWNERRQKV
jgi:hypothetical protein